MKRYLLPVFCLFVFLSARAQPNYTVRYKAQYLTRVFDAQNRLSNEWLFEPSGDAYALTINNSLSSFFITARARNFNRHTTRYPVDTVIYYTDATAGYTYAPVHPLTEKTLMVKDTLKNLKWFFTTNTDIICGFSCREAIAVKGQTYVHAWYAYELPENFGPFSYTGLPGTVLCVQFNNSMVRYLAVDVAEGAPKISIPETRFMAPEDYAAILREKRLYRGGFFGPMLDPVEVPRAIVLPGRLGRTRF